MEEQIDTQDHKHVDKDIQPGLIKGHHHADNEKQHRHFRRSAEELQRAAQCGPVDHIALEIGFGDLINLLLFLFHDRSPF